MFLLLFLGSIRIIMDVQIFAGEIIRFIGQLPCGHHAIPIVAKELRSGQPAALDLFDAHGILLAAAPAEQIAFNQPGDEHPCRYIRLEVFELLREFPVVMPFCLIIGVLLSRGKANKKMRSCSLIVDSFCPSRKEYSYKNFKSDKLI